MTPSQVYKHWLHQGQNLNHKIINVHSVYAKITANNVPLFEVQAEVLFEELSLLSPDPLYGPSTVTKQMFINVKNDHHKNPSYIQ